MPSNFTLLSQTRTSGVNKQGLSYESSAQPCFEAALVREVVVFARDLAVQEERRLAQRQQAVLRAAHGHDSERVRVNDRLHVLAVL